MRILTIALGLALGAYVIVSGQANDPLLEKQLKQVFPNAVSFDQRTGDPPHMKVYGPNKTIIGYAWWTIDLEPLERAYDGPIKILAGMDLNGMLTGIVVAKHNEPYGYFSIELPAFAAQFKGKSIKDSFTLGRDVDEVSRATISISSSARAIKKSSRRIARAFLTPPSTSK